jgi:hypothetical protein
VLACHGAVYFCGMSNCFFELWQWHAEKCVMLMLRYWSWSCYLQLPTSHSHSRNFIFMFIDQSYRSHQYSESLTVTYNKIYLINHIYPIYTNQNQEFQGKKKRSCCSLGFSQVFSSLFPDDNSTVVRKSIDPTVMIDFQDSGITDVRIL